VQKGSLLNDPETIIIFLWQNFLQKKYRLQPPLWFGMDRSNIGYKYGSNMEKGTPTISGRTSYYSYSI